MPKQRDEKDICQDMAGMYAKRDWHTLSNSQRDIVKDLVSLGYLNPTYGGFVGSLITK